MITVWFDYIAGLSQSSFQEATFCCVGIAGLRFLIRAAGQNFNTGQRKNVGIYGAGAAGRPVEALKWSKLSRCLLMDDNVKLHGQILVGKIESFESALKRIKSVDDTVLVAMPSASRRHRAIFHLLTETS